MAQIAYPYNPGGNNPACFIPKEVHSVNISTDPNRNYIVPNAAPFFLIGLKVYRKVGSAYTLLTEGVDYRPATKFADASQSLQKEIFGAILLYGFTGTVDIAIDYNTLGANWVMDDVGVVRNLINLAGGPRVVYWEQVKDKPDVFPPGPHEQPIDTFKGFDEMVDATNDVAAAIREGNEDPGNVGARLTQHQTQPSGSHTPAQVGLGMVKNAPMADNTTAIAGLSVDHYSNPATTKAQIEAGKSATTGKLHNPFQLNITGVVIASAVAVDGSGNITLTTTWAGGSPPGTSSWTTLNDRPADLVSGKLDLSRIPDLAASIITSGVFATARIPGLPASQITTGVFDAARIPVLDASQLPAIDIIAKTTGTLSIARGGTGATTEAGVRTALSLDQVPNYAAANTAQANLGTSTTLLMTPKTSKDAVATWPSLSAGKFTNPISVTLTGDMTGTVASFDGSANLSLNVAYAGVVPIDKIPDIPATKITGVLDVAHGGTGGSTQSAARDGLGVGTMGTYDVAVGSGTPTQRPGIPLIWLIPVS